MLILLHLLNILSILCLISVFLILSVVPLIYGRTTLWVLLPCMFLVVECCVNSASGISVLLEDSFSAVSSLLMLFGLVGIDRSMCLGFEDGC